ncbi:hypothetical protein Pfo_018055, partial [Paulownia fortunei]
SWKPRCCLYLHLHLHLHLLHSFNSFFSLFFINLYQDFQLSHYRKKPQQAEECWVKKTYSTLGLLHTQTHTHTHDVKEEKLEEVQMHMQVKAKILVKYQFFLSLSGSSLSPKHTLTQTSVILLLRPIDVFLLLEFLMGFQRSH